MILRFLKWMVKKKSKKALFEKKKHSRGESDSVSRNTWITFERLPVRTLSRKSRSLMLIFLVVAFFLFQSVQVVGILIFLTVLAALSKLIQEPIPFVVGLDLCLFVTVVVGYAIHPALGFLIGGTSSFLGSLLRSRQEADTMLVPIAGYFWVSVLVSFMRNQTSLFDVGLASTILYAFHNAFIFGKIRHFSIHTITFVVTVVPFNILLIRKLAPLILSFLS